MFLRVCFRCPDQIFRETADISGRIRFPDLGSILLHFFQTGSIVDQHMAKELQKVVLTLKDLPGAVFFVL